MGADLSQESKRQGRKPVNTELNLVPFIDLLSCLISFLLITAVWTRIAAVQGFMPRGVENRAEIDHINAVTLSLVLMADGHCEVRYNTSTTLLPAAAGRLDEEAIETMLRGPQKGDGATIVRIRVWDEVSCDELARAKDLLAEHGWPAPAVFSAT